MTETEIAFAEPGGEWTLLNLSGNKFGSYNLRGFYYLMFFGNTLSPDVTPFTLMKMTKAVKQVLRNKESQYVRCKCVFVTVQPDYDTPEKLRKYCDDMFDPEAQLIALREKSNDNENLKTVMRNYRVPVGLTPEEQEKATEFFNKKQKKESSWMNFGKKKKMQALYSDNKNSKVIYLMGPDNKFL